MTLSHCGNKGWNMPIGTVLAAMYTCSYMFNSVHIGVMATVSADVVAIGFVSSGCIAT